ncbi:MAG: bifunctional helix-turn-helix transcriptional regulator/GNAT family N-acetyltransferase [Thermomicrobiales bacterium]
MSEFAVAPSSPSNGPLSQQVASMRAFNRFYTQRIGVLEDGYLDSPFSLAQARVLYELAHRAQPTASAIAAGLGLDTGYLSRILRGFERAGLLEKTPSPRDGRQRLLSLTARGRAAFAPLDARSRAETVAMLSGLTVAERRRLLDATDAIREMLGDRTGVDAPFLLRPQRPGDMGWVVARHGFLYAEEYGWDDSFEALVAEIVAAFTRGFDPARERCWIAERDGENVGSVFLVAHPEREGVAKLRLLQVEPSARGLGIGHRLVDECTRFARQAGYHTITLWTNSVLVSARRIYEAAGYRLVHEAPHHRFGHDLVEQTWELSLR